MTLHDMYAETRAIIFLDFDGVLCIDKINNSRMLQENLVSPASQCAEYWSKLVDANEAANLLEIYVEFAPLFVISSSWATYFDKHQLIEILQRASLSFVANALHREWRTERALSSSRRDEVDGWLQRYRTRGEPFLVLDDNNSGWSLAHSPLALDGHVVLCDERTGFTEVELEAARRALIRQLWFARHVL